MRLFAGLAALCCLCAALALSARAAEPLAPANLLSLGKAPASLTNESAAREAAVQDALRRGVAQTALELADRGLLAAGLEALESQVLAKASSFVSAYAPQAQTKGAQGYSALVSLTVDRAALAKALAAAGLAKTQLKSPPVLALVSQELAPGAPPSYWWAAGEPQPALPPLVAQALKDLGLPVLDPAASAGRVPDEARQPVLSEEQAASLGRSLGAGLVLLGRVRPYPAAGAGAPPLVQVMAIEAAGGKVLASEESEAPQLPPGPEANERVAVLARQGLMRLIASAVGGLPAEVLAEQELILSLSGLRSLADLVRFEQTLRKLTPLVVEVRRDFLGGGKAGIRVKTRGSAERLGQEILAQNFGDFLVNVVRTAPQGLDLRLMPKTQ